MTHLIRRVNQELITSTKEFLRMVLKQLQCDRLETAIALEELAEEIRAAVENPL